MAGADGLKVHAGSLDRRVTIMRAAGEIDDGMRVKPGGWLELCKRSAALTSLTGAERVVAAENAAVTMLKFRIRRDSVTATIGPKQHRLIYAGTSYDIESVDEVGKTAFDLLVTGRADGSEDSQA